MKIDRQLINDALGKLVQLRRLIHGKEQDAKALPPPKLRPLAEIQTEYNRVCCELGHRSYEHSMEAKALEQLREKCEALRLEAVRASEAEKKAEQKAA